MGLLDDDDLEEIAALIEEANKFKPQELTEGNVQAIFNRCLTKKDGEAYLISDVFSPLLGYEAGNTRLFAKDSILKNKQNILYLIGQLAGVHSQKKALAKSEFSMAYNGQWTDSEEILLDLLYLAGCDEVTAILPFNKKENDSALIGSIIRATLSPKDPNFPAWWETHKAEWEG